MVGFQLVPTILSHGWCQLPPFSYQTDPTLVLRRVERLYDGTLLAFEIEAADETVQIRSDRALSPAQVNDVQAVVRRCLMYDQDLSEFYALLGAHSRYSWVERQGAGRLLTGTSVWEDLAKTLLTTNTTWTMTRQMVERLVMMGDTYGEDHAFPTPEQVAAPGPEALNAQVRAGYRGAYLHELAEKIASGTVDVEQWYGDALPSEEIYRQIRALKGFGDYAVGSVMRLLGHHDTLGIDSVARAMFRLKFNGGEKGSDAVIRAHYEAFGRWRGLALWMDVIAEDDEE